MEPASPGTPALPSDLLLVEDDPIIALDFEDTILGLGVKTVRTAAGVARALQLIADRAPDFALLDVSLVREEPCDRRAARRIEHPVRLCHRLQHRRRASRKRLRGGRG